MHYTMYCLSPLLRPKMLWTTCELCSELERQQNEEKDNPNAGLGPRTFYYPGRCPKPVRLEGISYLRLMIAQDHNTLFSEKARTVERSVLTSRCVRLSFPRRSICMVPHQGSISISYPKSQYLYI
jgi:hypothetical protein